MFRSGRELAQVSSAAGLGSTAGVAGKPLSRAPGSVLMLSMRRIARLVAYCIEYEFEDVVADLTAADRVDMDSAALSDLSRRLYKYTRFATGSRSIARLGLLAQPAVRLNRDYELFFPVFNEPFELFALAAVPEWRKRSRLAACFISEIWLHLCPTYLIELLSEFDHIFLGVQHSVPEVARVTGRPCSYLPLAADVLRFAPPPGPWTRPIDVCNIGRRSEPTHEALLRMAEDPRFFYYHDTVAATGNGLKQRTFVVQDPREHRLMFARLLKRSRFFLANRGFANDPEFTKGQDEISSRFYEGAAAGTVMVGAPPETEDFRRQFDWPDTVIRTPFDIPDIARLLAELEKDQPRLARIRCENVRNAALRHDWLHRLQAVFEVLGLAWTPAMLARGRALQAVAAKATQGGPEVPLERSSFAS